MEPDLDGRWDVPLTGAATFVLFLRGGAPTFRLLLPLGKERKQTFVTPHCDLGIRDLVCLSDPPCLRDHGVYQEDWDYGDRWIRLLMGYGFFLVQTSQGEEFGARSCDVGPELYGVRSKMETIRLLDPSQREVAERSPVPWEDEPESIRRMRAHFDSGEAMVRAEWAFIAEQRRLGRRAPPEGWRRAFREARLAEHP